MANPAPKRGPSILVTDAREQQRPTQGQGERPGGPARRPTSRFITVDNVLQYTSDIPSAQSRLPPRPRNVRIPSGRQPLQPKVPGRSAPTPAIPGRTTKVSEKLVLLPEAERNEDDDETAIEKDDYDEENDAAPERDTEAQDRAAKTTKGRKSYAERLTKARRAEKYARVTAYCTAQAFRLSAVAEFLRDVHKARTKLYDDCLYAVYHLPLLPGGEGYRVRSSPVLKNPGGKAVLDLEIERNERRDYGDGFFEDDRGERYGIRRDEDAAEADKSGLDQASPLSPATDGALNSVFARDGQRRHSDSDAMGAGPQGRIAPDSSMFAEMYIFSYGIAVFWNFSEMQEKDVLADLTFFQPMPLAPAKSLRLNSMSVGSSINSAVHSSYAPLAGRAQPDGIPSGRKSSLVISPFQSEDVETEEFHFEYDVSQPRPRIFNDMITLRSGDHMIKLTLAHAIAQSTKLSYFEQQMARQMAEAQHVPKTLALTGTLGMKRTEVFRILGALFRSRVDVNLSSSVLDTPDFFWTDEPPLLPLYTSMRTYLEIDPRVKTLNERCQVFLDLAEILSDSVNDTKMSTLTWIVIILILISIGVTCTEVFLRFGLLTKGKTDGQGELLELVRVVVENGTKYLVANGTKYMQAAGHGGGGTYIYDAMANVADASKEL